MGKKGLVSLCVPAPIALDLGGPICSVGLGHGVMSGTAVPEAAVHEDRNPGSGEDHVSGTSYVLQGSPVDEVAQSASMDRSTKCELWTCVAPAVGSHARANPRRGCPRSLFGHTFDCSGESVQPTSRRNLR